MQPRLDEEDVLNGDIEALISPYLTANLWVSRSIPLIRNRVDANMPKVVYVLLHLVKELGHS